MIADLRLTGIYGVEGLDIIQWSRHLRPETRVVLLTGNGTPEIEAEARRRGAPTPSCTSRCPSRSWSGSWTA